MTRARTMILTTVLLAGGAAWAAIAVGFDGFRDVVFDTRLDAFPYRMALAVAVLAAVAVLFLPAFAARRARCAMALQALLSFCLFLNGVEVVTPFQLAMGAFLISVIGFLALGRFERPAGERP